MSASEINPGIFLRWEYPSPEQKQMIIQNARSNNVDITLDITGSQGFIIKESNSQTRTARVRANSNGLIATIIQERPGRLKMSFKIQNQALSRNESIQLVKEERRAISQMLHESKEHYRRGVNYHFLNKYGIFQAHQNFIDPFFGPIDLSALLGSKQPYQTVIHWRRPNEFFQGDFDVFQDQIEPNDIKQGQLGDCWFMCALASLAERPFLVQRLFVKPKRRDEGIYRVQFCKGGEWVTVTIDDYFPCFPRGGPIFSRAHGNELWVLILEKAYAKLHGSYMLLRGGWAAEGMMDLTGCPTESFEFENPGVQDMIKNGKLWSMLQSLDDSGALISASTSGEDRWTETGGPNKKGGLVPGHAYTVIEIREAYGNRLLNIRNPWGRFEWEGDWSDHSSLWTDQMKKAINPTLDDNDGTFWMSFEDFQANFTGINICRVQHFQEQRIKGIFEKVTVSDQHIVASKWIYTITPKRSCRVYIGIHQDDERIYGVELTRPYLDIGMLILINEGEDLSLLEFKEGATDRQVELQINVEAGKTYIICPTTTGCTLQPPQNSELQAIQLLKSNELHPLFKSIIRDIFRKCNTILGEELSYNEFFTLFNQIGIRISETQYRGLMSHLASNEKGLVLEGFEEFMREMVLRYGEPTIRTWLRRWGYNEKLYSDTSRVYMLTLHAEQPLYIQMRHTAAELELTTTMFRLLLQKYGQLVSEKERVKLMKLMQRASNSFTFGVYNGNSYAMNVELNCSQSENIVFSNGRKIHMRTVAPHSWVLMVHCQIEKYAESCKLKPILRATRI